ncbi:MAG: hypothetical protein AABW71_04525 [Nanoarchaeota archaeon]
MADRTCRFCIVDDNEDSCVSFKMLMDKSRVNFPMEVVAHHVKPNSNGSLVETLSKVDADVYVMDCNLPDSMSGVQVALELSKKDRSKRFVFYSRAHPDQIREAISSAVTHRIGEDFLIIPFGEKVDFAVDKVIQTARKTIRVGATGGGKFGKQLLRRCAISDYYVSHVDFFSRHTADATDEIFTKAQSALDKEYSGRVTLHHDLKSLVGAKPDVLFLTASDRSRTYDGTRIMYDPVMDPARLAFFEGEADLNIETAGIIINNGFEGLVVPLMNPSLGQSRILQRKGYCPNKITTPFNLDTLRGIETLKSQAGNIAEKSGLERAQVDYILGFINPEYFVGFRGMPELVVSSELERRIFAEGYTLHSKDRPSFKINEWLEGVCDSLKGATRLSWSVGREEAELTEETDLEITSPAKALFEFIIDLASYRPSLSANSSCFFPRLEAHVALPSNVRYSKNGFEIEPNYNAIIKMGLERLYSPNGPNLGDVTRRHLESIDKILVAKGHS